VGQYTGESADCRSTFCETGKDAIPIFAGIETTSKVPLDHARWAQGLPPRAKPFGSSVGFILEQIRRYPNQITLIAIAPLTNIGALIERDPETFGSSSGW